MASPLRDECIKPTRVGDTWELDCPPDVDQTGDFHDKVRPIFETATNHCASCHGPLQTSPAQMDRRRRAVSLKRRPRSA